MGSHRANGESRGDARRGTGPPPMMIGLGEDRLTKEKFIVVKGMVGVQVEIPLDLENILRMAHQGYPELYAMIGLEILQQPPASLLGPDGNPV